jgi:hypothetical protein
MILEANMQKIGLAALGVVAGMSSCSLAPASALVGPLAVSPTPQASAPAAPAATPADPSKRAG